MHEPRHTCTHTYISSHTRFILGAKVALCSRTGLWGAKFGTADGLAWLGQRILLCLMCDMDCAETSSWQEGTTCTHCGWLQGGPPHFVRPDEPPVTSSLPAPSPALSALSPAPVTHQCQATAYFFHVCFSAAVSTLTFMRVMWHGVLTTWGGDHLRSADSSSTLTVTALELCSK